ncbi:DUF6677 family protein [Alienimonas sp. DA493]|uniref:DUF6677 family protein n=1 Tax=Alienimonas sp. DA493 TaxID=3373605 RepID=UPI0037545219
MSDDAAPPTADPPAAAASAAPAVPADDAPVELKSRPIAGLLAAALPGAGHFYQGRTVKGAIYCVCILGLFLCGQALGGWHTVALESNAPGVPRGSEEFDGPGDNPFRVPFGPPRRQLLQHYTAQVFTGVVAWPALLQSERFDSETNVPRRRLIGPLDAPFEGVLMADYEDRPVVLATLDGRVNAVPRGDGSRVEGTLEVAAAAPTDPRLRTGFEGSTGVVFPDGPPRQITLTPTTVRAFDRPINGEQGRLLKLMVDPAALSAIALPNGVAADELERPRAVGTVPRPLWNWYLAPRDRRAANRLHAEQGTTMDLAVVFTMIAGLLNVLAFWDAIDGPAYGRTDRRLEHDDSERGGPDGDAGPEPNDAPSHSPGVPAPAAV